MVSVCRFQTRRTRLAPMVKTTTMLPTGDVGPSMATFLVDLAKPPSCPKTLSKRPYWDKTEEVAFDVTNP